MSQNMFKNLHMCMLSDFLLLVIYKCESLSNQYITWFEEKLE